MFVKQFQYMKKWKIYAQRLKTKIIVEKHSLFHARYVFINELELMQLKKILFFKQINETRHSFRICAFDLTAYFILKRDNTQTCLIRVDIHLKNIVIVISVALWARFYRDTLVIWGIRMIALLKKFWISCYNENLLLIIAVLIWCFN